MTLTIEIDAETERALRAEAASTNGDPSLIVASIVRDKLIPSKPGGDTIQDRLARLETSRRMVRELNDGVKMPVLPEEAFARESFYQDHD